MNWIDEEAEKCRAAEELKEHREDLILRSDYWAEVRLQIEKDVAQINNHEFWNKKLRNTPIEIIGANGSYEIQKQFFPEVSVSVHNKLDAIEIVTKIKKNPDSKRESKTETLKIDSDGEKIYLQSQTGILHIPKETAKYILTPIIQALNKTL